MPRIGPAEAGHYERCLTPQFAFVASGFSRTSKRGRGPQAQDRASNRQIVQSANR